MIWRCAKLTPLQSRLAACLGALAALSLILCTFSNPHFAYAGELEVDGSGQSRVAEDHSWHRIEEDEGGEDEDESDLDMTATFAARAPVSSSTISGNNVGNAANIEPGSTTVWRYSNELLRANNTARGPGLPENVSLPSHEREDHSELRRRADLSEELAELEGRQANGSRTMYISMNTCLQPRFNGSGTQINAPPQLTLYVSTSSDNEEPGPDGESNLQQQIELDGGFARMSVQADGDWYMAVSAPDLPTDFQDVWNYEIAVSIDDYFHAAETDLPFLHYVDSDTVSALLITGNLTQANASHPSYEQWMDLTAPYTIFASNANHTQTYGLHNSYCGLQTLSQFEGKQNDPNGTETAVRMSMITRGIGAKPKEQFHLTGLNASSTYVATLALAGNSTASGEGVVGGGGKVQRGIDFRTKSATNCALLFDLDFCTDVAYAVPSHPDVAANFTNLQHIYDNYTTFFYTHFNYTLQQIPCDIAPEGQYSLSRNCDDCARAYKEWLCAVSIPRCESFDAPQPYLQIRNVGQPFPGNDSLLPDDVLNRPYVPMPGAPTLQGTTAFSQTLISSLATNSSRNPQIDELIKPGPYKEVLPCEDLCYNLMRSCPASMGFGCPFPGRGLEVGYGKRQVGEIACNFMGAYLEEGGAGVLAVGAMFRTVGFAAVVGLLVMAW